MHFSHTASQSREERAHQAHTILSKQLVQRYRSNLAKRQISLHVHVLPQASVPGAPAYMFLVPCYMHTAEHTEHMTCCNALTGVCKTHLLHHNVLQFFYRRMERILPPMLKPYVMRQKQWGQRLLWLQATVTPALVKSWQS
jgi:hypothetical protein